VADPDHEGADALHDGLGRWAEEHARRYPDMGVLGYDPVARPEQRLDTFKSPIRLQEGTLGGPARSRFETTMGPAAGHALVALDEHGSNGGASPRDAIAERISAGRTVTVLVAHAGGFEDMGVFPGAVAVALEEPELVARNAVILNKVMTRETYKGHSVRDLYASFANVYWVIPTTESMTRWNLDPGVVRYMNVKALRAIRTDMAQGMVMTLAPGGSAMRELRDSAGRLTGLQLPPIASATAGLIERFDSYICGAFWQHEIALGPVREVASVAPGGLEQRILGEMAELTRSLVGVPVTHESPATTAA
jgi:hypothetical protein